MYINIRSFRHFYAIQGMIFLHATSIRKAPDALGHVFASSFAMVRCPKSCGWRVLLFCFVQGSLNGTHFGEIKQCKYLEILRGFQ